MPMYVYGNDAWIVDTDNVVGKKGTGLTRGVVGGRGGGIHRWVHRGGWKCIKEGIRRGGGGKNVATYKP